MPGGAVIRLIRSRVFVASTELPSAALSECTCTCVRLCLLLRAYVLACLRACERAPIGVLYSDPLGALVYVRLTKKEKAMSLDQFIRGGPTKWESIIVIIIVIILVINPICALSHFNQRGTEEMTAGRARFIELSSMLVTGNRRDWSISG